MAIHALLLRYCTAIPDSDISTVCALTTLHSMELWTEPSRAWTSELLLLEPEKAALANRSGETDESIRARLLEDGFRADVEGVLLTDDADEYDGFAQPASKRPKGKKVAPISPPRSSVAVAAAAAVEIEPRKPTTKPWGQVHPDLVFGTLQFVSTSYLTAPQAMYDNVLLHMFYAESRPVADACK